MRSESVSSKLSDSITQYKLTDEDVHQAWFVGVQEDGVCVKACEAALKVRSLTSNGEGNYFVRVHPDDQSLQVGYIQDQQLFFEAVIIKKGKYQVFGIKQPSLTALMKAIVKKPVKGVKGKSKKLQLTLTLDYTWDDGAGPLVPMMEEAGDDKDDYLQADTLTLTGQQPSDANDDFGGFGDDDGGGGGGGLQRSSGSFYGGFGSGAKSQDSHATESFGGFGGGEGSTSANTDAGDGYLDMNDDETGGFGDVEAAQAQAVEAPAWYAGKLGRSACEGVVTSGRPGDFVVRESTRGDKCVICVNDHGVAKNLLINVLPSGMYQFAGKELNSLNDVVYMLRQRPIEGKSGKIMLNAPPVGLAAVLQQQGGVGVGAFAAKRGLTSVHGKASIDHTDFATGMRMESVGHGGSLYEEVTAGGGKPATFGDENIYMAHNPADFGGLSGAGPDDDTISIELLDANVPTFAEVARIEEEYRASATGQDRLSNQDFFKTRAQARKRAETANRENKEKIARRAAKTAAWTRLSSANDEPDEFDQYTNASMSGFGMEEAEDIYDAVPQWFAPSLSREACDAAVAAGNAGDFLVRDSQKGDRYVICVNHLGKSKNFQILVENGKYKFSGKLHDTLERGAGEPAVAAAPLL